MTAEQIAFIKDSFPGGKLIGDVDRIAPTPSSSIGGGRWRKALAIGLAGLGLAISPMARAAGSEAQWDAALNRAWMQLTPKERQELFSFDTDLPLPRASICS